MGKERWWTAPAVAESGKTVIVTGRDYMDDIKAKGKFPYRVDVSWKYTSKPDGMPVEEDAEKLELITDAFLAEFKRDKCAHLTGIYTGDGERDWIFYTGNLNIFNKVFNRSLSEIEETIPFEITAESDPEWEEYRDMKESTYIPEDDSEF